MNINEHSGSSSNQSGSALKPDNDELGIIGISLGLTAFSATIVFAENVNSVIRVICLVMYILGGLASSFLYYAFLINKIPEFMNKWRDQGGPGTSIGILWIYKYYLGIFFRQMFHPKGNKLNVIRELGYLTVLAILHILWITFGLAMIQFLPIKIV
jgi:hypothetical protein